MTRSFYKKIGNFVRSIDSYGHPVNIMYKKNATFKSRIGGVFTILARMAILIYFCFSLADVINKKTTVTNSSYIRNTAVDTTEYHYDLNNFDIAVSLRY